MHEQTLEYTLRAQAAVVAATLEMTPIEVGAYMQELLSRAESARGLPTHGDAQLRANLSWLRTGTRSRARTNECRGPADPSRCLPRQPGAGPEFVIIKAGFEVHAMPIPPKRATRYEQSTMAFRQAV
jgi:hypothetical protein